MQSQSLFVVAVGLAAFLALAAFFLLFIHMQEKAKLKKHATEVVSPHLKVLDERTEGESPVVEKFSTIFGGLRARVGGGTNKKTEDRFAQAGISDPRAQNVYFGLRVVVPFTLLICMSFISTNFVLLIGAAGVGYLIPDFALERFIKSRQGKLSRSIPDTLDLLIICMNAGLGIDSAIERTAQTLRLVFPDFSRELLEAIRVQKLGFTRVAAWRQMHERTKCQSIHQIALLFNQAEEFGTPIVQALRGLADSLRMQRRQKAEEKAAKKSIQLLLPLALFIFPVILIILMGPAVISIVHGFGSFGH